MANPVVTEVVVWAQKPAAAPASTFEWDVEFTTVTSAGTRGYYRRGLGTNAAGLTLAQVKTALLAQATADDAAEKNPPAPPPKAFAGVWDTVSGNKITEPTDPRLPPGVVIVSP